MGNKEERIRSLIGQACGEVSMCWDPPPQGVFQSLVATRVVDRVMLDIQDVLSEDDNPPFAA